MIIAVASPPGAGKTHWIHQQLAQTSKPVGYFSPQTDSVPIDATYLQSECPQLKLYQTGEEAELDKTITYLEIPWYLDLAGIAYEKILARQPDSIDALSNLAGIRFEQRQYEAAEKMYSQILGQKPQSQEAQRAMADLNAILDKPLAALEQMEQLQIQQMSQGVTDTELSRRMQQIQEDFLLRRGFQPTWEDPNRRVRN